MIVKRRLPIRVFVVAVATAIAAAWPAAAQKRAVPEVAVFTVDSTLVLVPVTVVDRRGAMVTGLPKEAFTLTEDGVAQPVRSFSEEDAPVSIGVVLDLSGSMKRDLNSAKESLRSLMRDANPADEAFLNAVSTQPRAYSGFTQDFGDVLSRVASEDAFGTTALIDTIEDSLQESRSGTRARKALLVISDGMDNHSRYTREDLLRTAEESDAQIYTIAVVTAVNPVQPPKPMVMTESKRGLLFLEDLAEKSGGISFAVSGRTDIAKAAASIGQALRNQYVIGYAPPPRGDAAGSGKRHKIAVKVAGQGLRAYARAGYRLD
jgi:Ca-activated chloride channel family protein